MRLASFDLIEPIPELKAPHAIAMLRPWIDAGNVGTLTLERLENLFEARELGKLVRPGNFFDFTRYRPTLFWREGIREVSIPNTTITYARRESGNDFVFFHLLEPHMLSEAYINSVLAVIKRLGIQSYCLLGSMYDMVPHTRPLLVSGGSGGKKSSNLESLGIRTNHHYEGPTTICHLISQEAQKLGVDSISLMVHLPQYTEVEDDYMGEVALLQVLGSIYGIPVSESEVRKAEKQLAELDKAVKVNRKLQGVISQLEAHYDARMARQKGETPQLSAEVEKFLKEMENRFGPS